jgi:hypothetical protein
MVSDHWTIDDMVRLAASGVGFRLNASGNFVCNGPFSIDDLASIAAAAKKGNSQVVICFGNPKAWRPDALAKIGAAGAGHVFFESISYELDGANCRMSTR